MALNTLFNGTDWSQASDNLLDSSTNSNGSLGFGPWTWTLSNGTQPLSYNETPTELRQYLLILRLVLLGIGSFDTLLLLFVYIKCSNIISSSLGVYVANLSIAALIDFADISVWSVKEFGYSIHDVQGLPWWAYDSVKMVQFGLPTTSLFLFLLLLDRLFATFFSGCHLGCYGSKINAVLISLIVWLGSFFMTFILVFPDLLFPDDKLHELLRFLISYLGPFGLKLLLVIVLFAKRKMVPDSEQSQSLIHRQRESLYYVLTILTLHLVLSLPYYALQSNVYFKLVDVQLDEWIVTLTYTISQIPLILNPVLCLSIDPEFRDSLVYVCTCSGMRRRGEGGDLCDDHGESQPLAPLATSPITDEKDGRLEDAES